MKKRRIDLNINEDIVEALQGMDGRGLSSLANQILRRGLEYEAHRTAMRTWTEDLNRRFGRATPEQGAQISAFLNSVEAAEPASVCEPP